MISVEIQRELLWFIFVLFIGNGRVTHNAASAAPQERVAGSEIRPFSLCSFRAGSILKLSQ